MRRSYPSARRNIPVGNYPNLVEYLKQTLPDFCWQTPKEVLSIVDEVMNDGNFTTRDMSVRLYKLTMSGFMERKRACATVGMRTGPMGYLFKRKSA